MKHYILTHPEHFPEPKKVLLVNPNSLADATEPNVSHQLQNIFFQVKYLDKLEPWIPVRW